ncbi:MAG: hypothetical protein U5K79_23085 [Cyclobacteriaceae bacterium]|nr:hypothetical protein [Cyclobacteriaceae bacterium]
MKNVGPACPPGELGVKTFFNMLGPLVNPSFPKKQIDRLFPVWRLRSALCLLIQADGYRLLWWFMRSDGYDEVSAYW